MGKVIKFPTKIKEQPEDSQAGEDQPSFATFAMAVMANDDVAAKSSLSNVLNIADSEAEAALAHFVGQMNSDPAFLQKAKSLRFAISSENTNDVLELLNICFGITGLEAMTIYQHLIDTFSDS